MRKPESSLISVEGEAKTMSLLWSLLQTVSFAEANILLAESSVRDSPLDIISSKKQLAKVLSSQLEFICHCLDDCELMNPLAGKYCVYFDYQTPVQCLLHVITVTREQLKNVFICQDIWNIQQ